MNESSNLFETIGNLRAAFQQMARWGCAGFDCPQETLARLERWTDAPPAVESISSKPPKTSDGRPEMDRRVIESESLEQIRSDLGDCRRCGLSGGRTHIVFGQGAADARLVFVGEGPGFEEDRQGLAFVGPAGQLLTKIIEAMKLSREQVYICNVIKCRPPENRDPAPDEIDACRPFLERQLAAIAPEVICTLGTPAAQTLLNTTTPVSRLRGRFHQYRKIRLMPTYHPAYLLRHPEHKGDVWQDVKKIMALLRIPL